MSAKSIFRHTLHKIEQHPGAGVTFEAECLWCEWKAGPSTGGAAVDFAWMSHTGRSGHSGFRRVCTSFAMVYVPSGGPYGSSGQRTCRTRSAR
ncbi:DUF7848 domain-containing protein [Streptomyces celluloflavus]